jgi:hypothetical protein
MAQRIAKKGAKMTDLVGIMETVEFRNVNALHELRQW